MKLQDKSGLSSLILAILAPQIFGKPVLNEKDFSLSSQKLNSSQISFIPTATNVASQLLPETTNINIPKEQISAEQFKQIIEDVKNHIPNSGLTKRIEINTQAEFNQQALKLLREAKDNNQIYSPNIPYNNIVDIQPCIDELKKAFPEIANNFSINEACDIAYKEIFPDYANRESIAKEKNTQRLVKIIVPSVLAPTMLVVTLLACCCCVGSTAFGIKKIIH